MTTFIRTEDGTCIIVDPDVGVVTRRTREEAEAEVRRLRVYRNLRSDAGLEIVHRHREITA